MKELKKKGATAAGGINTYLHMLQAQAPEMGVSRAAIVASASSLQLRMTAAWPRETA